GFYQSPPTPANPPLNRPARTTALRITSAPGSPAGGGTGPRIRGQRSALTWPAVSYSPSSARRFPAPQVTWALRTLPAPRERRGRVGFVGIPQHRPAHHRGCEQDIQDCLLRCNLVTIHPESIKAMKRQKLPQEDHSCEFAFPMFFKNMVISPSK
ncbi:hypothetical protein DV515_00004090, partial [Chloebia gouldiae]